MIEMATKLTARFAPVAEGMARLTGSALARAGTALADAVRDEVAQMWREANGREGLDWAAERAALGYTPDWRGDPGVEEAGGGLLRVRTYTTTRMGHRVAVWFEVTPEQYALNKQYQFDRAISRRERRRVADEAYTRWVAEAPDLARDYEAMTARNAELRREWRAERARRIAEAAAHENLFSGWFISEITAAFRDGLTTEVRT